MELLDEGVVVEIVPLLGEQTFAFGPRIDDRDAWRELARKPGGDAIVETAEAFANASMPEMTDELYQEFHRTGRRSPDYQRTLEDRRIRVKWFALAECLEDQGRFHKPLHETVASLCAERTWIYAFHDRDLSNFNGERIDVDLASVRPSYNLSQAAWMLGDRLPAETRSLIEENVHRRTLEPVRAMVTGAREPNRWVTVENNWNSVCLCGVTGAALALLADREERAFFAAIASQFSRHFLDGFGSDGYCSEGVGYWNYGFFHYIKLAELLWQATSGKLDLYEREGAREAATYPLRIEIMNGIYPAYADCGVGARPSASAMVFVSRKYGLGLSEWEEKAQEEAMGKIAIAASSSAARSRYRGPLHETMLSLCPNSATQAAPAKKAEDVGLRSWFGEAGVLTCRPRAGSDCRMGVSMKGGHNRENHNHNDVGSYVVVMGTDMVLLDPGAEVYTGRTFSKDRYESNVLNSFGHPAPMVAGQLQRTGSDARAEVLKTEFGDETDTLALDLRSAYDVPELVTLERAFSYSRAGTGSFSVEDRVAFSAPQKFGTALITAGEWEQIADDALVIRGKRDAVHVDITVEGGTFEIVDEVIDEEVRMPVKPTRIGINLILPVAQARIGLKITPEAL